MPQYAAESSGDGPGELLTSARSAVKGVAVAPLDSSLPFSRFELTIINAIPTVFHIWQSVNTSSKFNVFAAILGNNVYARTRSRTHLSHLGPRARCMYTVERVLGVSISACACASHEQETASGARRLALR